MPIEFIGREVHSTIVVKMSTLSLSQFITLVTLDLSKTDDIDWIKIAREEKQEEEMHVFI